MMHAARLSRFWVNLDRVHARAFSVASDLEAVQVRAIRIEIDRLLARGASFREGYPALMRAANAVPQDQRGGM